MAKNTTCTEKITIQKMMKMVITRTYSKHIKEEKAGIK